MRLLLDMGLPVASAAFLRGRGMDAVHLGEQGLHRLPDAEIVRKAVAESRILVTFDLDFPRLLALLRAARPSTILFRLESFTTTALNLRLLSVLHDHGAELEAGAVVVVETDRVRTRALPVW